MIPCSLLGKSMFWAILLAAVPVVFDDSGVCEASKETLLTQTNVAQYREWTRVNPKPVILHAADARLCRGPLPSEMPSIHRDKYITVYVNTAGKNAMLTQEKPQFPVGTVIVKEKRATPTAAPELLTVMVKRGKNFAPRNGDWEYAVLNGNATQIQEQGKISRCQSCHQQNDLDYTFRSNYFPWSPSVRSPSPPTRANP